MDQFYDIAGEPVAPSVVEFELKDTELFSCPNCKKTFVRIKSYRQILNPLWCTKCSIERDVVLEQSRVGIDFGQSRS